MDKNEMLTEEVTNTVLDGAIDGASDEGSILDGEADMTSEADSTQPPSEPSQEDERDDGYFDRLASEDIDEIHRAFPESATISSVTQLDNPLRYATLRDLGLSAKEAYLATQTRREHYDNRKHLRSSVPSASYASPDTMSQSELKMARELFSGLDDRELQRLFKRVSK